MRYIILIVLFFYNTVCFSQSTLYGNISGSDNNTLQNVNILAFPLDKEANMSFSTSKANGSYSIELKDNTTYKLTLSHIGYITYNDTLTVKKNNLKKNFTLQLDPNELKEVILEYKPDINVRKDTITYNVSAFVNGNERKLREVLKKLPGVTVDKKGNVESQGKKVTQVLVENKKFFNGNTNVAVNNIPADVVKEVEIIDDYHETAFMKGIENSEEIALNINLQDDKKNFIFGDLEAGIGIDKKYKVHPTFFKYGTKATYNLIGDLNNTDEKSFTIKDLIDFEGGFDKDNITNIYSSSLAQSFRVQDFNENKHKFGALNFQLNPNTKNEFRIFAIGMLDKSKYKNRYSNTYVTDNNSKQIRKTNTQDNLHALFSKLHYKYKGDNNTELKMESRLDISDLKSAFINTTQFLNNNFNYNTNTILDETKFSLAVDYKNKINKTHTFTFNTSYTNKTRNGLNNWLSQDNLFNDAIPIQNSNFYTIVNPNNYIDNILDATLKYYWIVNRKTHLNFGIKNEYLHNNFDYSTYQELNNGNQNVFQDFLNETKSNYNKFEFYIETKKVFGNFLLETKITLEQNNWKSDQSTINFNKNKSFILPNAILSWEPTNKKKLKISYRNESRFFHFRNSVVSNQIRNFNSLFLGDENLPLSKYEVFSINYKNYKSYSISYYPSFTYRKRSKEVINQTVLNNIYNVTSPTTLNTPNESYHLRLRTKYNRKYFNISLTPSYEIFNFKSIINNVITNNKNHTFSTYLDFKTNFEENINYDFSINYNNRINNSDTFKSIVNSTNIYLGLSHELEKWTFKIDGSQTYFKSKNAIDRNSDFNTFNFSILYHKEDNPWSFELKAKNILNNQSNNTSSFNGIVLELDETFVFPRYVLFNVYYKL
ncbi:carboxypeptidase-like regulatory domain-containing protein [uncultured Lacinutrix sp.]|uniref:carboxypeptidase-like regulatory domain-containing protein n=1 Tax=uncultured Lacinutrix sp. TaxID=574032 RepID=UPI00260D10A1|nr:carboxypeptidase-like regulatory domain-containing protein [uncultured Lacinutrix sp.]